jgi:hypothetical protein
MTPQSPRSIAEFLDSLHLARPQEHPGLTLWPLTREGEPSTIAYRCLADALADGAAKVDEVTADGSVPHVALDNRGDVSVLVLFGEEIVGAKQNRVANASFLVAPHSRVDLDVSCVEQGRWSSGPKSGFRAGKGVLSSRARETMAGDVEESLARGRGFSASQGSVWDEVQTRVLGMESPSPTSAYSDYAQSLEPELERAARSFPSVAGQVGFVAKTGRRIVGLEAVGDPLVYARVHERLLRAYTIDVVDGKRARSDATTHAAFSEPPAFLEAVAGSRVATSPSLAQGQDLRLQHGSAAGTALVCAEVVHLMAFPRRGVESPSRWSLPGRLAGRIRRG